MEGVFSVIGTLAIIVGLIFLVQNIKSRKAAGPGAGNYPPRPGSGEDGPSAPESPNVVGGGTGKDVVGGGTGEA